MVIVVALDAAWTLPAKAAMTAAATIAKSAVVRFALIP
jgi:hypothetical protein